MAGGIGSRFWPLSTNVCPKQFLDPLGTGKSFIRSTFERFLSIIPAENFFIVTSDIYKEKVLEHIPELSEDQVLLEPVRRNTAPCIAYASHKIYKRNPLANIIVAPSDHIITGEIQFIEIIKNGLKFVDNSENLLTIGIKPTRPETGYGYIQFDKSIEINNINKVKTFTEKPDLEMAKVFINSGEFLWNSGIFIWSAKGILSAFKKNLPDINNAFEACQNVYDSPNEQEFINNVYTQCMNISIDYGIMEKSKNVYVQAGSFGWSDVGTWGSLYNIAQKNDENNVTIGNVLTYNTKNSIISIPNNRIAVVEGLDGYMVVANGRNLLICKTENEQSIKNWVDDVKFKFGHEYI